MLSEAVKILKGEYTVRAIDEHKMDQDKAIIFCRTKIDCDNMEQYLNRRGGGGESQTNLFLVFFLSNFVKTVLSCEWQAAITSTLVFVSMATGGLRSAPPTWRLSNAAKCVSSSAPTWQPVASISPAYRTVGTASHYCGFPT